MNEHKLIKETENVQTTLQVQHTAAEPQHNKTQRNQADKLHTLYSKYSEPRAKSEKETPKRLHRTQFNTESLTL